MVIFNSTEYQFAHGCSPRGTGLWLFNVGHGQGNWLVEHFRFNGPFGAAKKAAIKFAQANGCSFVMVCS